jgi:LPXTG-motif cell wall-anchored protein
VVLATAVLSLALAAPAQALTVGDCAVQLLAGCATQDQAQAQAQNSTNTNTNQQSVVVQQQQAQQGGDDNGDNGDNGVRHVTPTVVHRRQFFVRPAARRAFFVRGVTLARTGFDAWMLGLAGVGCMAGGLALMARRRRSSA